MAEVWVADSHGLGGFRKRVALKLVREDVHTDERFLELFFREARLSALFNHPNLLQSYDFGEAGGRHYIAMELCEGVSLSQLLKRARASSTGGIGGPVVAALGAQLGAALSYLAAFVDEAGQVRPVVHLDVSPDNVFVTREGMAKLIDFGIAVGGTEQLPEPNGQGEIRGKPSYMAPEMLFGQAVTPGFDVFSLGMVLWEAAAGRRMYQGKSLDILKAKLNDPIAPIGAVAEDMPGELASLIDRALAKTAADRIDAETLRKGCERWLALHESETSAAILGRFMKRPEREPAFDGSAVGGWLEMPGAEASAPPSTDPSGTPFQDFLVEGLGPQKFVSLSLPPGGVKAEALEPEVLDGDALLQIEEEVDVGFTVDLSRALLEVAPDWLDLTPGGSVSGGRWTGPAPSAPHQPSIVVDQLATTDHLLAAFPGDPIPEATPGRPLDVRPVVNESARTLLVPVLAQPVTPAAPLRSLPTPQPMRVGPTPAPFRSGPTPQPVRAGATPQPRPVSAPSQAPVPTPSPRSFLGGGTPSQPQPRPASSSGAPRVAGGPQRPPTQPGPAVIAAGTPLGRAPSSPANPRVDARAPTPSAALEAVRASLAGGPPPVVVVPKRVKPAHIAAGLGLGLLLVGGGIFLATRTPRPPSEDPSRIAAREQAQKARAEEAASDARLGLADLSIDSTPTGAEVFLDGAVVGRTPWQKKVVVLTKRLVEVKKEGFKTWQREVATPVGFSAVIVLEPLPKPAP